MLPGEGQFLLQKGNHQHTVLRREEGELSTDSFREWRIIDESLRKANANEGLSEGHVVVNCSERGDSLREEQVTNLALGTRA
jgi:hypothetical protein